MASSATRPIGRDITLPSLLFDSGDALISERAGILAQIGVIEHGSWDDLGFIGAPLLLLSGEAFLSTDYGADGV